MNTENCEGAGMALDPHSINSKEAKIAERRLPAAETLLPPSHQNVQYSVPVPWKN